jgi:perosamine synthetase
MELIPFSRPYIGEAEARAVTDTINSGWIVGGPRLAEFERRYAELCGAPYAIGVSSWTTGAFLVLHSWGIGPGDEVIVPSLTFIASANVVVHAGATPIFAEIDSTTWNIDPNDVERKITPRTKAIIPVAQLGLPCAIDRINEIADRTGLHVLHDAACSFGSRIRGRPVGSFARTTVFSLHARKIVTTGEGGVIVTFDNELADRLRRLRHQGMSQSDFARHSAKPTLFETYDEVGYNFRITDIQAAIGLAQLDRLSDILARRTAIARRYLAGLKRIRFVNGPHIAEGILPNWQSFQIALAPKAPLSRDELMEHLYSRGISTRRGVMASHLEPALQRFRLPLPKTEAAASQCLQLPIFPGLRENETDMVLSAMQDVLGSC